MFAVRDTRTGKFLRKFTKKKRFDADDLNEARLYTNKGHILTSFEEERLGGEEGSGRRKLLPLSEACPWLEIVEVKVVLA